jgi:hypothetical protein
MTNPLPTFDNARREAEHRARLAEQALAILDALDACQPGESLIAALGRDCNGVAFVRAADGAVHRGASIRDALAQFVQSRVA